MPFHCAEPLSTVFYFCWSHGSLRENSGGVFFSWRTGLRFVSSIVILGYYNARIVHDMFFLRITAVNITGLDLLFNAYFDFLSGMSASMLPLVLHQL